VRAGFLLLSSGSDIVWLVGSFAALAQAKLFGPAIPKGNWFGILQRLTMAKL